MAWERLQDESLAKDKCIKRLKIDFTNQTRLAEITGMRLRALRRQNEEQADRNQELEGRLDILEDITHSENRKLTALANEYDELIDKNEGLADRISTVEDIKNELYELNVNARKENAEQAAKIEKLESENKRLRDELSDAPPAKRSNITYYPIGICKITHH